MVVKLGKILHKLVSKLTQYGITCCTDWCLWYNFAQIGGEATRYCVLLTPICEKMLPISLYNHVPFFIPYF